MDTALMGHPATSPTLMLRAVGPYGNLYARVPTAWGLAALAHSLKVPSFVGLESNFPHAQEE
jgi:hypothetical protein